MVFPLAERAKVEVPKNLSYFPMKESTTRINIGHLLATKLGNNAREVSVASISMAESAVNTPTPSIDLSRI